MVEMAIVLPVLMLLVFGTIEFGRLYNAQVTLTHAAREGIRDYAIHQDSSQAEGVARDAASPTLVTTQMAFATSACDPGDPATMTITYPFSMAIPFFQSDIVTLSGEGVMRCGG